MKRILLSVSVVISGFTAMSQWTTLGNGNVHTTNLNTNVGINTNTPGYALDVNGWMHGNSTLLMDTKVAGDITVHLKGPVGRGPNLVLQGGGTGQVAYWLTGDNTALKIGGNGWNEPAIGAINVLVNGNVGVGTATPGSFKLAVEGMIGAREVKVTVANPWPDYVFSKEYKLMSLAKLEEFINRNKHLPNLPSAQEVEEQKGIELGDVTSKLLEKIEELTLHVIELNKKMEMQAEEINKLRNK
ncbi:hypothetical protein HHL16_19090 [Pseudoflavitalea sp. G-6-1-2]|uniref:hypothetical protein n=1 Tax=Pseudoflavitalea sp. G-6-1-2 TaxID=2728841 RepID=UPI00146F6CFC|nr:hypothetical protein [Pseudoflavitalea sp. G-6-1-2]NML22991.1 hypothetical protein [Pseudoflavitalea sp. G-6-1-2]